MPISPGIATNRVRGSRLGARKRNKSHEQQKRQCVLSFPTHNVLVSQDDNEAASGLRRNEKGSAKVEKSGRLDGCRTQGSLLWRQ